MVVGSDFLNGFWNSVVTGDHNDLVNIRLSVHVSLEASIWMEILKVGSLVNVVDVLHIGDEGLIEKVTDDGLGLGSALDCHHHPRDTGRSGGPDVLVGLREGSLARCSA